MEHLGIKENKVELRNCFSEKKCDKISKQTIFEEHVKENRGKKRNLSSISNKKNIQQKKIRGPYKKKSIPILQCDDKNKVITDDNDLFFSIDELCNDSIFLH